jgi:hypothetical protein
VADPHILSTLSAKQAEIESYIRRLEKQLDQARHDLAHVNATMRLFEVNGERTEFPVYVQLKRLFSRGELPRLCREALEASPEGELDTRQLAAHVMAAKGWETTDRALTTSVTFRVSQTMDEHSKRTGKVRKAGKRAGVNVWRSI